MPPNMDNNCPNLQTLKATLEVPWEWTFRWQSAPSRIDPCEQTLVANQTVQNVYANILRGHNDDILASRCIWDKDNRQTRSAIASELHLYFYFKFT